MTFGLDFFPLLPSREKFSLMRSDQTHLRLIRSYRETVGIETYERLIRFYRETVG